MRLLLPILLALCSPALAQTITLAPGQVATVAADGRVLGHLPYASVASADLVMGPAGFGVGQPCRIHRDAAADLIRLVEASHAAGLGQQLRGVSCYRAVEHQRSVFCGRGRRCGDAATRARLVGPPGFSEHATGYALDFAVRPQGNCRDVDDCIARTPAGAWLLANAVRFGFELSFPAGNAQGVTWEPWHWRWVGANGDVPGAARARLVFARARAQFPANPAIVPLVIRVLSQPPVPAVTVPPTPDPKSRRRRR